MSRLQVEQIEKDLLDVDCKYLPSTFGLKDPILSGNCAESPEQIDWATNGKLAVRRSVAKKGKKQLVTPRPSGIANERVEQAISDAISGERHLIASYVARESSKIKHTVIDAKLHVVLDNGDKVNFDGKRCAYIVSQTNPTKLDVVKNDYPYALVAYDDNDTPVAMLLALRGDNG